MPSKEESLKESGSFNRRFTSVRADIFKVSPFFDAKDIVQVKYEMLRAVTRDEGSVAETADKFGFSRKTYYQASRAFEGGGLEALLPKKTGPKGPSKLQGEAGEFIAAYMSAHKDANAAEISAQMEAALGIRVHPRTIERYLEKKTGPSSKP